VNFKQLTIVEKHFKFDYFNVLNFITKIICKICRNDIFKEGVKEGVYGSVGQES